MSVIGRLLAAASALTLPQRSQAQQSLYFHIMVCCRTDGLYLAKAIVPRTTIGSEAG